MTTRINYLDLFSGIGGFAKGLQDAGVEVKNHYYSEIDKHCIDLYEKHFPEAIGLGDISTIRDFSKLEDEGIDLITFGFPYQGLSIAGKQKGLEGSRSGLFFEAVRLIKELKPTYFIFENVKGLFSSNEGRDFKRCLQEIADIGLYDCEWQLVNTSWFLPKNRERIYFIGHLRNYSRPKVFPIRESNKKITELQRQYTNTITARYGNAESTGTYIIESQLHEQTKGNSQGNRINTIRGNSACISANGGGQGGKTGLYAIPVITSDREHKRQNGRRFKENNDPSFTLTAQDRHGFYDGINIRKLTPIECERLQGFPDNWTKTDKNGNIIADSNRYRMLGNAVTVKVVEEIMRRLFK